MNTAEAILGVCLVCAGGGLVLWQTKRQVEKTSPTVKNTLPQVVASTAPVARRPARQMPIQTSAQLLAQAECQGMVEQIRTRLGLTPENYARDVAPLIANFVEFVQLLPASQSHHHAQPGGLVQHTLEVASHSLALREGYKLPKGTVPEEQIRLGPVWTFGLLVAALLHDIGKPVADVVVTLYGSDPNKPLKTWSGLAGSMRLTQDATHYTVDFPDVSDYGAHQRLPTSLLHAMVPAGALQWLSTDPLLFKELLNYLDGGATDGVLKEIITKADQLSVSENLKSGTRIRFAASNSTPLIERLMAGLRAVLAEGHMAINRPGAAAFVDPDGQHIWLVAGAAADQVRQLLSSREVKPGKSAGIPTDNTRLFDTWNEYGALIQPPKEYGKGSVWWARIEIDEWTHVLTLLKFPIELVYPSEAKRPAPLVGSITPVEPSTPRSEQETSTSTQEAAQQAPSTMEQSVADVTIQTPSTATDDSESWMTIAPDTPTEQVDASESPPPPSPSPATPTIEEPEFLDEGESAGAAIETKGRQPTKAVQALTPTNKQPKALYRMPGAIARPNADKFVGWIQQGLGTGSLSYNEADSLVHFVPEGMAILTPKAFKVYLEENSFEGSTGTSIDPLRALQNEIQKAGYLAVNKEVSPPSKFHYYQTQRADGKRGAVITTYLIPNPQAYVRPVPAHNPLLAKADKPEAK